ncbi:hypothetical protein GGI42DRAFT_3135 [Trichoderma sp. SZMC 28013]
MERQIFIELEEKNDLEYHLPNEIDKFGRPIPHRKDVTGTDRQGKARLMSVTGLMPILIHGFANDEPHSLVVFEWGICCGRPGLRYKSVMIEVSFHANGPRGDAEYEAQELRQRGGNLNFWDPEIVTAVPSGTTYYNPTQHKIGGKNTLELGFSAGFAPHFTVGPKYVMERDTTANATASVKVIGQPFVTGFGRSRSNAIRWTVLENESQRSGVPSFMRTAVLLKRQPDDNGLFLGNVKVETHVSWWEDMMEKKRKMTGDIRPDDPIVFDPKISPPSPFDDKRDELDVVDIHSEFKIISLDQDLSNKP